MFESASTLCRVLELKYDLGVRTRKAYQTGDKAELKTLVGDYRETVARLEKFYKKFRALWYKENHPSGFDVQDLRLGGLKQRLISCLERLEEYLAGTIESIPELEEKILPYFEAKETPCYIGWKINASANRI